MKQSITVSIALLAVLAAVAVPANSQNSTQDVTISSSSVLKFETNTNSGTIVPVSALQFKGLPAWAKLNDTTVIADPPENQLETVPVCVKYAGADNIFRYRSISLTADTKPKATVQNTLFSTIGWVNYSAPSGNSVVVVLPGPTVYPSGEEEEAKESSNSKNSNKPIIYGKTATKAGASTKAATYSKATGRVGATAFECNEASFLLMTAVNSVNLNGCGNVKASLATAEGQLAAAKKKLNDAEAQYADLGGQLQTLGKKRSWLIHEIGSQGSLRKPSVQALPIIGLSLQGQILAAEVERRAVVKNRDLAVAGLTQSQKEHTSLRNSYNALQDKLTKTQETISTAQLTVSYYQQQQSSNAFIASENEANHIAPGLEASQNRLMRKYSDATALKIA